MMEPTTILGPAAKELYTFARDRLSKYLDKSEPTWAPVFEHLETYVGEVLRWSSRIQFFGMPEAEDTDTTTIRLRLSLEPRRFSHTLPAGETCDENDLLVGPENYVILGDPGSGKSTTLKRVARAVMMNEPVSAEDIYRYPVVIRLREHTSATDPDVVLADTVGIPYSIRKEEKQPPIFMSGNQRLSDLVPRFLNEVNAIVMLDGLDELPRHTRHIFEKWMVTLSYRLTTSKLLATSRSGDYGRHLDGFNLLEICPLSQDQIQSIAQKWLPNPDEFLRLLNDLPYGDLADRPLLLLQLIVLFRRDRMLPEQPAQVYRRLLRLLLQDWDKEHGITRSSHYSGFDPDQKADFLAALSYYLTYKLQQRSFSFQDLVTVYRRIHKRFGLPEIEAKQVAEEIASHSGLIAASGFGYEFSHLSFQEYLCAEHLVREPFPVHLERYIMDYPGPLAVAVTISTNPADWFTSLILRTQNFQAFTSESLYSFLARVRIERPRFDKQTALGMAVMRLFYAAAYGTAVRNEMQFLLEDDGVIESIRAALLFYAIPVKNQTRKEELILHSTSKLQNRYGYETPEWVSVPEATLTRIIASRWIELRVEGDPQRSVRVDDHGKMYY
jgi:hypothetical protein